MAALAVRGLSARTARRLKEVARKSGVSVNKLVVSVLERAAGTAPVAPAGRPLHHDLDELLGTWSEAQHRAFSRAVRAFERIDDEMWK